MIADVADSSSIATAEENCKPKNDSLEDEEDGEIVEDIVMTDCKTDSEGFVCQAVALRRLLSLLPLFLRCNVSIRHTTSTPLLHARVILKNHLMTILPEEILNSVAKSKVEEMMPRQPDIIDPKLCAMCQKIPHKYRCPKCDMRTCSLPCSKQHKEVKECDGVRPPYQPVSKLSQFDTSKSIQDQQFLHTVKNNISKPQVNTPVSPEQHDSLEKSLPSSACLEKAKEANCSASNGIDSVDEATEGLRYKANSAQERYLVQNALRRRIWLSFTDDKGGEDSSRHEQFSDTIFWCVDLIFTKELEDGTASEYTYRVQNIPETIRVETVLRQFLKPRQHGCILESRISTDLCLFLTWNRRDTMESILERIFLHNTRNRVIVNHPRIIITLNTEFISSHQLISELEAEEIREKQRLSRAMYRAAEAGSSGGSDRCPPRRSRGDFRGGQRYSRGAFHGNRGFKDRFNRKREYNFNDRRSNENKRGRPGTDGRRHPAHNYRSLDDEFDPFEPFEGPVRLPQSYLGVEKLTNENTQSERNSSKSDSSGQKNSAIKNMGRVHCPKRKVHFIACTGVISKERRRTKPLFSLLFQYSILSLKILSTGPLSCLLSYVPLPMFEFSVRSPFFY
ncbi:hypothetical protein KIN20_034180 [Parelaphostrongylus tenuis]|uniref:Box C/D snoRNA protein 1 n=1 Tax=Parelaphostrongylus tenuis TaxID=148309 RepID=A0AAD5WIU6_PARTN|nr:hypothetical protein KIN20_034180 [Parelaphostrongylus tenuis]